MNDGSINLPLDRVAITLAPDPLELGEGFRGWPEHELLVYLLASKGSLHGVLPFFVHKDSKLVLGCVALAESEARSVLHPGLKGVIDQEGAAKLSYKRVNTSDYRAF